MTHTRFRLKANNLYIFPLSDLHLGHENCNLDYFEEWEEVFNRTTEKKVIYILGDMLDMPHSKQDPFCSEGKVEEQMDLLIDLLKPYSKYINYYVAGNHEKRTRQQFNLDISKIIAKQLDCPYSYNDFFDTLTINKQDFIVYGKHGTRWSKSPDLAMRGFKTDLASINADLCMQGHNHYSAFSSDYLRCDNGGKRKYYCFSGNFLKYKNSYAHDKGTIMTPESFTRLELNRKLKMDCRIFHRDEVIV